MTIPLSHGIGDIIVPIYSTGHVRLVNKDVERVPNLEPFESVASPARLWSVGIHERVEVVEQPRSSTDYKNEGDYGELTDRLSTPLGVPWGLFLLPSELLRLRLS